MFEKRGAERLSRDDIDDNEWRDFVTGMMISSAERKSTTTFAAAINYIRERQPKIVIFENVETAPWESTADYVFPLAGYSVKIIKLDTKHFYLPQTRSRKYVVAFNHRFFGVTVAQELCGKIESALVSLKRPYSSAVTDFLLPVNSHELHRARNEMEFAARSGREREFEWSLSKSRHETFRDTFDLGDSRPWVQWKENGSSNAPDKMWKPWEAWQPNRVSDVLECTFLAGIKGKNPKHGAYDLRFKAQIIDCSQNVDRVNMGTPFGATGCLTPSAIPVLTLEARPITGLEALKLQGMPVENFNMSVETQSQLQDLAGNAMTTTVVGATLIASLACAARYSFEKDLGWLKMLFPKRDNEENAKKDRNSYKAHGEVPLGEFSDITDLVLFAHCRPNQDISEILDLGRMTRRRCVCHHVLSYSSMELFECKVCGASFCKSCKGNPEHQLVKLANSFEDMGCLSFANAEYSLRKFFPPILPMLSCTEDTTTNGLIHKLICGQDAMYSASEADVLVNQILAGLCSTVYQLKFIEITDVTRIEYVSKDNFILRVIVEARQIIWYLHLDQWSEAAKKLNGKHKTREPIARAILGPKANNQFPVSWEPWCPREVEFTVRLRPEENSKLRLISIEVEQPLANTEFQNDIAHLNNTVWVKCEECGFPEYALWVTQVDSQKFYLFKDVNSIGAASKDEFIITTVSREMGRTPVAESRPALLRMRCDSQLHCIIENMTMYSEFSVTGYVTGRWLRGEKELIRIPQLASNLADQPFPASLPVKIRQPGLDPKLAFHGEKLPCDRDQVLLEMSFPIFGISEDAVSKVLKTLRDLDLSQQLDFAEFTRLIGPCYSAVERRLLKFCDGDRTLQLWEVELAQECETCAPRPPSLRWEKPQGAGSKGLGPIAARCHEMDQKVYDSNIRKQPVAFRVDHNVDAAMSSRYKKDNRFSYIDIRFVARAHTLLQQARSFHPRHPAYHHDPVTMKGRFSIEFCVLEDSRPDLQPIRIQPPRYNKNTARQPSGFKRNMALFDEQLASLEWMITRENDEKATRFIEREVAEVYTDHLRLRLRAQTSKHITRRGRVVADSVGFGKTAVCLGLIDRQHSNDRNAFLDLRTQDSSLDDLIHLHATLVIVPNQLTEQWRKEAERFLNPTSYKILVISTFEDLQQKGISGLKKADMVICSNKIFQDAKYMAELSKICDPIRLNVTVLPKVYRAWYKTLHEILASVRQLMTDFLLQDTMPTKQQALLRKLQKSLEELRRQDSLEPRLAFLPSGDLTKWRPRVLLELFSFARVIWDEFPYKNIQVTEFVANCPTVSKWMLSGTPPLESLGDIARIAYLFNVHLARPLALVGGRQPHVCENPPLEPLSELEQAELYRSRHSPTLLKERHGSALYFVRKFMRKNVRTLEVKSIAKPIVLSSSSNSRIAYLELQQELSNRTFNANRVSGDARRRLMDRVNWKGTKLGTERAMEALILRASSSYKDVRDNTSFEDLPKGASVTMIADTNHKNCLQMIKDMEDRGRELLGKAIYLAYRLAYINIKRHTKAADNAEERHFDYYEKLRKVVNNILAVNIKQYSGWDAYESALRILIWDDNLQEMLGPMNDVDEPPTGLPSTCNPEAWKKTVQGYWDQMSFCGILGDRPQPFEQGRPGVLKEKQEWLCTFANHLAKTPLHSRRWFSVHNLKGIEKDDEEGSKKKGNKDGSDFLLVNSLLEMEWELKVPWEQRFRTSEGDKTSNLVPIRDLAMPSSPSVNNIFHLADLKRMDKARESHLTETTDETLDYVEKEMTARIGKKPKRDDWQEECSRRGLVYKSTEVLSILQKRVCLDMEKKASEKDYITSDGCHLQIVDLPVEGKQRIRGSNMEPIFDQLMRTVDKLIDHLGRLPEVYGKRNLQEVLSRVSRRTWNCDEHGRDDALKSHFVSLACGHVHCSLSSAPGGRACGIRGCTAFIKKDTCILLSKLSEKPRTIHALDLDPGALANDARAYLDDVDESQSPKARAVANLIRSTDTTDQVVVFVQNESILNDVYRALEISSIQHVTAKELQANEAGALEMFKAGLDDDGVPVVKRKKVLVQMIESEQAAGSNLHNANHVIFVSPLITRNQNEWDAQMKQALGRCVRYRQKKTVYIYHFVVDETIEADTLEWRMKQEIFVRPGRSVGRFNECTVPEFLERFDADEQRGTDDEGRAISMLARGDVQFLMGDDYISVAAARSAKTMESAKTAAAEEEEDTELAAEDSGYENGAVGFEDDDGDVRMDGI